MNQPKHIQKYLLIPTAAMFTIIIAGCATLDSNPADNRQTSEVQGAVVIDSTRNEDGEQVLDEIVVFSSRAPAYRGRIAPRTPTRGSSFDLADHDIDAFARVQPGEDIWIIAKPDGASQPSREDDTPGSGAMIAYQPNDEAGDSYAKTIEIPLPLQHTDVKARIDGYIGSVSVEQQFANPFDTKIEAVYLFPLPEKAAVTEFVMVIGERRIRGILREKEEAVAIYEQARAQGYQVSLLTQHRPNVFEQKVANIDPGKRIDVRIDYFHTLAYRDGWYSFVFPTVVGPRFNPPGHPDPVHAEARSKPAKTDGVTATYLRPGERSAHDLSIQVEVDAGVSIEEIRSTHDIATDWHSPNRASIELAAVTTIPNRDFLLEYRVAGDTIKSNLLTHFDEEENQGYFTLMMYPPAELESLKRQPLELVFVVDCSGSMYGQPLKQAKVAISEALDRLETSDTFQIIRFSDDASFFGASPVRATPAHIKKARRYLRGLNGTGGTMMIEGIKAALSFPHDPSRLRFVSFLTDGYIGNESEIIAAVHDRIGASRIFSFGVGSSVNRYLLERLAKEGRGVVAYLGPQDSGRDVMNDFFDRIGHPAMTDVRLDWGSMVVTDRYPAKLPDLFVGRPLIVTGKYAGTTGEIVARGRAGAENIQVTLPVTDDNGNNAAIPKLWARLRIADLEDRQNWESDPSGELSSAIRQTALQYRLISDYTSFVAVDASERTDGNYGITVRQAVPVPAGVRYDTTIAQ